MNHLVARWAGESVEQDSVQETKLLHSWWLASGC